jgi:hypothetical protein
MKDEARIEHIESELKEYKKIINNIDEDHDKVVRAFFGLRRLMDEIDICIRLLVKPSEGNESICHKLECEIFKTIKECGNKLRNVVNRLMVHKISTDMVRLQADHIKRGNLSDSKYEEIHENIDRAAEISSKLYGYLGLTLTIMGLGHLVDKIPKDNMLRIIEKYEYMELSTKETILEKRDKLIYDDHIMDIKSLMYTYVGDKINAHRIAEQRIALSKNIHKSLENDEKLKREVRDRATKAMEDLFQENYEFPSND